MTAETVLVQVRCGGETGRCGRLLSEVVQRPDGMWLRLASRRIADSRRYSPLPPGLKGAVLVGRCTRHSRVLLDNSTYAVGGRTSQADDLLGDALERARRTGRRQTVSWTPWPSDGTPLPSYL